MRKNITRKINHNFILKNKMCKVCVLCLLCLVFIAVTVYCDNAVCVFVYNEILMRFPMKTLCREDCKGLCLKCGKNLNEGECGCDRASLDPRMSAIRDIFNNFKEV